ncbi:metalloregulator ArsR/SmtB family transcription factor [Ruegeria sp. SCPT10]|uniref:ArsR/SmtB family transcription factor n=1 Tax=Ruegeria sp. SCP10 TaxID=3141377 RepID=UPI00333DA3DB
MLLAIKPFGSGIGLKGVMQIRFSADDLDAKARAATDFLKTLAHDQRLLTVCLHMHGAKTVTELQQAFGVLQSATSQQISRLRLSGLVSGRREGKKIHY